MIGFQTLPPDKHHQAFEAVKDVIDMSHREAMLFDFLDYTFGYWLAYSEKHGHAFNFYKDQRELLDWSVYSMVQAYGYLNIMQPGRIYVWYMPHFERLAVSYYLDNALYRMHAMLERAYSFCNCWFDLGFTNNSGKLHAVGRLFEADALASNLNWANSPLLKVLNAIRASEEYNYCLLRVRNDAIHNLDPREYLVKYHREESLVEVADPPVSIDSDLLGKAKYLLKRLFYLRTLIAQELSHSFEKFGVRPITPLDQEYWSMSDSPLF